MRFATCVWMLIWVGRTGGSPCMCGTRHQAAMLPVLGCVHDRHVRVDVSREIETRVYMFLTGRACIFKQCDAADVDSRIEATGKAFGALRPTLPDSTSIHSYNVTYTPGRGGAPESRVRPVLRGSHHYSHPRLTPSYF